MQQKAIQFDPSGDEHFDLASALIKSIRGSDVDASLYCWPDRSSRVKTFAFFVADW